IINGFLGSGISITTNGTNAKVTGSYIGTDNTGTTGSPNANGGISIQGSGTIIGGTTAAERNVISGNTNDGIFICHCASATIKGNYIGTDATGTAAIGNSPY